jgi:hypothetical protein
MADSQNQALLFPNECLKNFNRKVSKFQMQLEKTPKNLNSRRRF